EILCDSPDGVMYYRDELSGFFGAIDKYAGVRGGGHDRGFWLQAYNGIREEMARKHHEEASAVEIINRKLAAHIRKYDGMSARFCLLFHCIEHPGTTATPQIDATCARRVATFLSQFLGRHAMAFYTSIYGLSDDYDRLTTVAGYILARKPERLTNRVIHRGDRSMRGLKRPEIEGICQQLDALGWVTEAPKKRTTDPSYWNVNP